MDEIQDVLVGGARDIGVESGDEKAAGIVQWGVGPPQEGGQSAF